MNKKALAILISVVMLISIMPATGLAALSENSYVGSKVDFTSYIKNGNNSSATSNPTAVATNNAGVSVDYEPVTGVFDFLFCVPHKTSIQDLPEDSSLRRSIKSHYINGHKILE